MADNPGENLLNPSVSHDDTFYDTMNTTGIDSAEYRGVGSHKSEATDPEEQARMQQEWKDELAKLEDEITTLRQVLGAKVRASNDLKRKLGITPIAEMRHDLKQGIQSIRESDAYQKTNATLKTVGQKTAAAVSGVGVFASRKLSDVRNSTAFKSFEEKVGGAYSNVKSRVRGSKSENNFEDVLNSTADAERDESATNFPARSPDEKVPL